MDPIPVVVLDADAGSRLQWSRMLAEVPGIELAGATGLVGEAIQLIRNRHPRVIILDPILPDWNAATVIHALRLWAPASLLLIATIPLTTEPAPRLLQAGATHYFDKRTDITRAMSVLVEIQDR